MDNAYNCASSVAFLCLKDGHGNMRIAICGAGWCGVQLSNLLTEYGKVDVYEKASKPQTICAWGITTKEFVNIARKFRLNPYDYILHEGKHLIIEGRKGKSVELPINNLCTFNKEQFMRHLRKLSSANFHFGETLKNFYDYDIIVDATGKRNILGRLPNDLFITNLQFKVKCESVPYTDFYMHIFPQQYGYLWFFPIGNGMAHIGCGTKDIMFARTRLFNFMRAYIAWGPPEQLHLDVKPVRLMSPHTSLPFYRKVDNTLIIGVGESIGTITCLGEGNALSARSVEILAEHLRDPYTYQRKILREFNYLKHDHALREAITQRNRLTALYHLLRDKQLLSRMGADTSMSTVTKLFSVLF